MCERKDGALEIYSEAKNMLKVDLDNGKITKEIFDELNKKALDLMNECEDYRDYQKCIYDLLLYNGHGESTIGEK